ncbi:hypothetical protein HMN09_00792000 [Mycena chlorophos]|uniref:Uncharacterized protein n=1 Tax=Mycena chlorophos TaxID=658473 RepID=A0A8H6SVF7_MYCCL|nr:hypothetical protein HMN09_00792000 [Mycena chlorophos]
MALRDADLLFQGAVLANVERYSNSYIADSEIVSGATVEAEATLVRQLERFVDYIKSREEVVKQLKLEEAGIVLDPHTGMDSGAPLYPKEFLSAFCNYLCLTRQGQRARRLTVSSLRNKFAVFFGMTRRRTGSSYDKDTIRHVMKHIEGVARLPFEFPTGVGEMDMPVVDAPQAHGASGEKPNTTKTELAEEDQATIQRFERADGNPQVHDDVMDVEQRYSSVVASTAGLQIPERLLSALDPALRAAWVEAVAGIPEGETQYSLAPQAVIAAVRRALLGQESP